MIWLWIAAALVSAALAVLVVQRAVSAARAQRTDNPALAVYRRQMAELDELAERGVLGEGERRSVRAETGRRLLAAAGREDAPLRRASPGVVMLAATAAPLAAVAAYFMLGAPGYPDQPFKTRLAAWRSADPQTLQAPQMAAILRAIAAERPTDPEPLRQLAVAEFASREPTEAVQALHRAIALAPGRPDLWELLGQALVVQAGGEANDDARVAFRRLLQLDPGNINARYYLARAKIAGGDVAGGLADWRSLQTAVPATDPRSAALAHDIAEASSTGRLPAAEGGEQAQVGGPQVQAMVDGLAARLQLHPDDPAGWARLVRAYTVLGEIRQRDLALATARGRYASRPDVLGELNAAAASPSPAKATVSPPAGSP